MFTETVEAESFTWLRGLDTISYIVPAFQAKTLTESAAHSRLFGM